MCLFLTRGFVESGKSAFLCLTVLLSLYLFTPTLFSKGRTPRPHQTLLFTEAELPRKRAISGDKRRQKHGYKVLCDLSPAERARVHTPFRGHKRLAPGGNMAPKGGILSSGERRRP